MLNEIKEKYNSYIGIYDNVLPKIEDGVARRLLENSLYLSIFTSFESFLKKVIEHYVEEKIRGEIKYIELNEGFARAYILDKEREIDHIFDPNEIKSKNAFSRYFNGLKEPLSKAELTRYVHFEFLHESKLTNYYGMLFDQILGNKDFLKEIKIPFSSPSFDAGVEQVTTLDAHTFLLMYCSKIRNNIAHDNSNFNVSEILFPDMIDCFIKIMESMKESYESYTGFNLSTDIEQNLLDLA